jgi:hypothetical protein
MAIRPYITVPQAPLSSRTVGFPESGWQPVIIGFFITQPSHLPGSLSARSHTPRGHTVYSATSRRLRFHRTRAQRPAVVSSVRRSLYREPLRPGAGVTSSQQGIRTPVGEHYSAFLAPTGSCARPKSSPSLGVTLGTGVFAGCCVPLLEVGPSQRYSAHLSRRAWTPTPPALVVHSPIPSHQTTAFPTNRSGRRYGNSSTATSVEVRFSRLQSFDSLQARRFARHPGCSYRSAQAPGSRGFYVPAELGLLPPRAGDMLAVRV